MKYTIDTEILDKESMGLDEALYLLSLYKKTPIDDTTIQKVESKGRLRKEDNVVEITGRGRLLMESILSKSKLHTTQTDLERFKILADKLRNIYPKGLKPGTNYQWRDSTAIIADRLIKLSAKYNVEFTDEEAVDATQRYVNSFNGNYKYMQLLKYFINKQRPVENAPAEQNSQFLSFLQNTESITTTEDWAANLV